MSTIEKDNTKQRGRADNLTLVAALDYAANGMPIFPCRLTKEPLTAHGFKDATTDQKQIRQWWNKWPHAMIGMPTGAVSGIDVLDLDLKPEEDIDGRKFVPNWKHLSNVIVRTPSGGRHVWFKSADKVRSTTDVIAPGVDTRGEGGYAIVPPSRNSDGDYSFTKGSRDDIADLPAFPPELLDKLGAKHTGAAADTPEADPEYVTAAMQVIPNPDLGWDDWKKFGMAIWRATAGSDAGFAIFDEWSRKSTKYDEANTHKEWDSIRHSPPTRIGAGTIFYHANAADPTWSRSVDALILPTGAPVRAAEAFVKHFWAAGETPLLRSYRGTFYRWTGTHYKEYDIEALEADLYRFLNAALAVGRNGALVPYNPTKNKVLEIVHALRLGCLIPQGWQTPCWLEGEYRPAPNLVACHNGILNLRTRKLQPHDPLFFSTNCLPLDYDPSAPEPKRWLQFLGELWPGDKDGRYDSEAEDMLQEIAGYLLTADTREQKIFMIIGPPRSGKGTIVHVLVSLLVMRTASFRP